MHNVDFHFKCFIYFLAIQLFYYTFTLSHVFQEALSNWDTIRLIKRLSRLDDDRAGDVAETPSALPAMSGKTPTKSGDSGIRFARRLYRLLSLSSEVYKVPTEDLQRATIVRLTLLNLLSTVHLHNELDGMKKLMNAFPESKSELLEQVSPLYANSHRSRSRAISRSSTNEIKVRSRASLLLCCI